MKNKGMNPECPKCGHDRVILEYRSPQSAWVRAIRGWLRLPTRTVESMSCACWVCGYHWYTEVLDDE